MLTRCPHCGKEQEVPPGAVAVVCNGCRRAFSMQAAERLSQRTAPTARTEEAPTVTSPRLRLNCPRCHKELTVPATQRDCSCPRCGASFATQPETDTEFHPATGTRIRTADTLPSGRIAEARRARQRAQELEWMRVHLSDRYEILEFVGRGGMGAVYKARQKMPSREVAIKVMLGGALVTEKQRKRFQREAQAVARLNHPAIVPVYEYGEVAGQPYFTMEFVSGVDLRSYVTRRNPSWEEICRIMVRICDAIHYAHQHGVIHRDLKPSNIMIDELNRVRILDFGLSRTTQPDQAAFSALTVTGDFVGTPRYSSPEQIMGLPREVDERTDVYSLGVILYELIIGVPPYPIDNVSLPRAIEILKTARPPNPAALRPDLPRDLELIMLKAVERDKELRYPSAEAFAADLENFLAGRPISARPATFGYRLSKWAWRHRKVLLPLAASFVVIVALSVAYVRHLQRLASGIRQVQSERDRYKAYIDEAASAREAVESLIAQGKWSVAFELSQVAPKLRPHEPDVEFLPADVQQQAEEAVGSLLEQLKVLLREQDYTAARQKASELAELASQIPLKDLRERATAPHASFDEICWQELTRALEESYTPADIRRRIEAYLAAFGEGTHAAEARKALQDSAAQPPEWFLQRHSDAFERSLRKFDWEGAERVLSSAERLMAAENSLLAAWSGRLAEMRQRLDGVITPTTSPRLRPVRRIPLERLGREGWTCFVKDVKFSPDGSFFAAALRDGTVRFWDCSGAVQGKHISFDSPLESVALSGDGNLMAVGGDAGFLCVAHMDGGHATQMRLAGHKYDVESVAFWPDGTKLLSADAERVAIWNLKAGQEAAEPKVPGSGPAALSPDGSLIASVLIKAEETAVLLCDSSTARVRRRMKTDGATVDSLAFSPDGHLVAATCRDRLVRIWRVKDGLPVCTIPATHARGRDLLSFPLAFSPDCRLLCTGGMGATVRLWRVPDGQMTAELTPVQVTGPTTLAMAFSPDQRLLVTAGSGFEVLIWSPLAAEGGVSD